MSRRVLAAMLVAVPLATALVPLVVPPWRFGLVPVRIGAAELGPAVALAALLLGTLAVRVAPSRGGLFAIVAIIAAGLAVVPTVTAQHAAQAGIAAVDALALPPNRGVPAMPHELTVPDGLIGAITGLPSAPSVVERVVRYAAVDGTPLAMRIYRDISSPVAARPTVVVVYGGAWRNGEATQGAPIQRWIAAHGYTVVALDYRHAPRVHFPAPVDDLRRGLVLMRDSAAAWGVDPARVALLGRSSGAHLAMMTAWGTGADAPPLPIRGVVDFYGPFDLVRGYVDRPSPDPIDVRAVLRGFVGGTPDEMPARYREASPASLVRPGLPPALLVYAGRDHLVKPEFGRAAAAALRQAGVPVVHVELPWAEHGFDLAAGGTEGTAALAVVMRFLGRVL